MVDLDRERQRHKASRMPKEPSLEPLRAREATDLGQLVQRRDEAVAEVTYDLQL